MKSAHGRRETAEKVSVPPPTSVGVRSACPRDAVCMCGCDLCESGRPAHVCYTAHLRRGRASQILLDTSFSTGILQSRSCLPRMISSAATREPRLVGHAQRLRAPLLDRVRPRRGPVSTRPGVQEGVLR